MNKHMFFEGTEGAFRETVRNFDYAFEIKRLMYDSPIADILKKMMRSSEAIRGLAVRVFRLFECHGVARIDFLLDDESDAVYFNEINTIPGSFAFYLWQPAGIEFPDLVDELIRIARVRARESSERVRTHDVNLLSERAVRGLKQAAP